MGNMAADMNNIAPGMGNMNWKNFFNRIKNNRAVLFSCVAVVVLAAALAIYLAVSRQSAREFYLKAEARNFKKYSEHLKALYAGFYSSQEPYMGGRYRKRSEFTLGITAENEELFGVKNPRALMDALKGSKLVLDVREDPLEDKVLANASLLYQRAPLIDAELYVRGGEMGFTVPVLMPDTWFLLKPRGMIRKADFARAIFFEGQEFDRVASRYGSLISGFIDEKDVRFGANTAVMIGGEKRKGREVFLSLDGEKMEKLFNAVLDEAQEDETLLKLTYGNLANISGVFRKAGLPELMQAAENLGLLSLNEHILSILQGLGAEYDVEGFRQAIGELKGKIKFPEGLNMKLVADRSGNILDRRLVLSFIPADTGNRQEIDIHSGPNDIDNAGLKNFFCTVQWTVYGPEQLQEGFGAQGDSSVQGVSASQSISGLPANKQSTVFEVDTRFEPGPKSGDEKGRVRIAYEKNRGENAVFGITAVFDSEYHADAAAQGPDRLVKYEIQVQGDRPELKDVISGELAVTTGRNDKLKTVNTESMLTVRMDLASMDIEDLAADIRIVTEDRLGIEAFDLPDIGELRKIRLDGISGEEKEALEREIMASFGTFYLNNKALVDSIME